MSRIAVGIPDENGDIKIVTKRAAQSGRLSPEAQAAVEAATRRAEMSAECRSRIFAVASPEAQANMGLAVGTIAAKTASARSDQEKGILAGATSGLEWVQAMRQAFEANAADASIDYKSDDAWPVCPPEALAVAGQF